MSTAQQRRRKPITKRERASELLHDGWSWVVRLTDALLSTTWRLRRYLVRRLVSSLGSVLGVVVLVFVLLHLIPGDHQIVRHSAAVLLGRICSSSHFLTDPIHDNIAPRAEPEVSLRAEAKCLQRSGFGSAALHEE
jgi:hypothetical protein